ncbi:transcription elongation factor GreA [Synergistales bacterium]|nr:transcription elongation factor GreA [Synergistales bacterium]
MAKIIDNEATMTQSGYDRMKAELIELRTNRRADIAKQLEEARSFGDLSENAEYATAKEEQAKIEARIGKLEAQLGKAKILDEDNLDTTRISMGLKVTLEDTGEPFKSYTYSIVGIGEADPKANSISQKSPVGQAIIGKTIGDEVVVKTPRGSRNLKVVSIEKIEKIEKLTA